MIQRKEYLKKLIAFRDKQLIKVVTGVRRCGKIYAPEDVSGVAEGTGGGSQPDHIH